MKVSGKLVCGICDSPIVGSLTIVPGVTPISVNLDGTVVQRGGVEIFWNKQRNVSDTFYKMWVQCANGHEWVVNVVDGV